MSGLPPPSCGGALAALTPLTGSSFGRARQPILASMSRGQWLRLDDAAPHRAPRDRRPGSAPRPPPTATGARIAHWAISPALSAGSRPCRFSLLSTGCTKKRTRKVTFHYLRAVFHRGHYPGAALGLVSAGRPIVCTARSCPAHRVRVPLPTSHFRFPVPRPLPALVVLTMRRDHVSPLFSALCSCIWRAMLTPTWRLPSNRYSCAL